MNKLLKILLWMLASIILLIILAAVLIPVLIDPNDYKEEIAAQVNKHTGRNLSINGNIDLSFSLPLSVSLDLGQVELSNATGFGDQPFAKINKASLFVAIWPLLTKNHLDIGKTQLSGMELNLIKNQQGQTNWEDLSKALNDTGSAVKPAETTTVAEPDTSSTPLTTVEGIIIEDATITWTDQQNPQHLALSNTDIFISRLVENTPFELSLSTHLASDKPAISGDITINSKPTISLAEQLFNLAETQLTLDLGGDAIPSGKNKTTLTGNIIYHGQKQQIDITSMKLSTYDVVLNGLLSAKTTDKGLQYNGKFSIDPFSPKQLAASLGTALPVMQNPSALTSADMQLEINGDQNQLAFSSLSAHLDETSLTGTAAIKNFQTSQYTFDLALNQLDLDFYATLDSEPKAAQTAVKNTPQKSTTGKAQPAGNSDTKSHASSSLLPLEALRQLNLDGKLSIGKFKAGGAKMTNVVIILKGEKGIIQIAPLKGDLYRGSINMSSTINATKKDPHIKLVTDLSQVQLGNLLMDTTGSSEFTGTANIKTKLTSIGNTQEQLLKNSNGSADLLITDGHIKSLDIISTLRTAQALYRGKALPTQSQDKDTKFTELKGTFNIKNGVVHNDDLFSRSPIMEFTGTGYADLPKEYMDYTLNVKLLNSLKIDDKTGSTDYKGQEFPYTIKGKFSDISQTASVDKVLEQQAKKTIEKKLNKEIERRFGDKFKDLIKF